MRTCLDRLQRSMPLLRYTPGSRLVPDSTEGNFKGYRGQSNLLYSWVYAVRGIDALLAAMLAMIVTRILDSRGLTLAGS